MVDEGDDDLAIGVGEQMEDWSMPVRRASSEPDHPRRSRCGRGKGP